MTSRPPGKRDLILKREARGRVNEASDGEVYALVYTGKRRLFRGSGEAPRVYPVLVLMSGLGHQEVVAWYVATSTHGLTW